RRDSRPQRRVASRRKPPAAGARRRRRLQEKQGHGRAPGRGHGEAPHAPRRDRQSVDADRPARRQADAHRTHHHRGGSRPHAGIRRYRPQFRARRRCRGWAPGGTAARQRGGTGERYTLGGENVSRRDSLAAAATMAGRRPPRIRVPIAPLYPPAVGAEAWARLTGREPFLTRDGLRMARHHMFFNDAKARGELGYSSRPYRDGLADAIAWFRKAGYLQ